MSKVTKAELEAEVNRLFPHADERQRLALQLFIDDDAGGAPGEVWQCRLLVGQVHIITTSLRRMSARRSLRDFLRSLSRANVEPTPEVCICAAVKLPDGRVIRGHRHADCLETAHRMVTWNGGVEPGEHHWHASHGRDQGFVTSRGRYVGREEGLRLQLAASVPSACPSGYRSRELFSEDLY